MEPTARWLLGSLEPRASDACPGPAGIPLPQRCSVNRSRLTFSECYPRVSHGRGPVPGTLKVSSRQSSPFLVHRAAPVPLALLRAAHLGQCSARCSASCWAAAGRFLYTSPQPGPPSRGGAASPGQQAPAWTAPRGPQSFPKLQQGHSRQPVSLTCARKVGPDPRTQTLSDSPVPESEVASHGLILPPFPSPKAFPKSGK